MTSVIYEGLLLALFLATIGTSQGIEQDTINYIARYLDVKYTVLNNIESSSGFTFRIRLTNSGPQVIAEGATGWSLYFNHIRLIEPDGLLENDGTYTSRNGTLLDGTGLRLFHVNGVLFRMTPTDSFAGIAAGAALDLNLFAKDWQVARTDIMPNWYVVGEEKDKTVPVTVSSTAGESLKFVEDFTTKEQSTRTKADKYSPYTLEYRYDMLSDVKDLGRAPLRIVPSVVKMDFSQDDTVDLRSGGWVISFADNSELEHKAKYLAGMIGMSVTSDAVSNRVIYLKVNPMVGTLENCTDNKETYTVDIDSEKEVVTITGREEVGVFWGIQTLISLEQHDSGLLPNGNIEDCPRFYYRGMHVDVARNFFPKETIIKLLDVMAMYKLNKFHFHITDDEGWRVEIPGIPELTTVGATRCHDLTGDRCIMPQLGASPGLSSPGSGFYTVEDYRDILTYANDRHIEVIPEFDMPGHAHAAINAMKARYRRYKDENVTAAEEFLLVDSNDTSKYLSVQTFIDNAMDPCLESTYSFIKRVIVEMKKMHLDIQPLKVFHFGGDEVPKTAWEESPACASLANYANVDKAELKKYFAQRVSEISSDEGLGLAAWEDGFMDRKEHAPFNLTELKNENVYTYAWNNVWEWGSGSRAYRMANDGYKAIISHATNFYFDHPNEPDPEERGYYWATRWTNARKTFGFAPDTIYDNMDFDLFGNPIDRENVCTRYGCPKLEKRENVLGVQGQLWSETVRTSRQFEAMVYPRLLALAERAWHKAPWEYESGPENQAAGKRKDWEQFSNLLGYKELGRLDKMDIEYHILPPGVKLEENKLSLNVEFPGQSGQISSDGGLSFCDVRGEREVQYGSTIHVVTRSADKSRMSRLTTITIPDEPVSSSSKCTYSLLLTLAVFIIGALAK